MLDFERERARRNRFQAVLLLLAACIGSSAHAAAQAEAPKLPSGAQLLASDMRHLSAEYRQCMTTAAALDARRRCIDAELKVHEDALDAAYSATGSNMSTDDQNVLRDQQRQWRDQRDSRCPQTSDAAAQLDAQQCRTHMTLLRARQLQGSGAATLVAEAKATPTQTQADAYSADAPPDDHGRIILQPGLGVISPPLQVMFNVADCSDIDNVTTCQVQAMEVTRDAQQMDVTGVQSWLTRAGVSAHGTTDAVLLNVTDLNGDGAPDLQVWLDNNGVYNVPVYAFYLFDAEDNRYVRANALEAAIGGRDIDHIDNGRFVLRAKVSPCEREDKVIQLRGTESRVLLERRYNTCNGDRPTESVLLK
jgi:uncharacterized protein YecT (DUF1311 family)